MRRAALLAMLAVLSVTVCAQEPSKPAKNITETDSALLWRNRFADCDHGYIVLLPKDFVGHSEKPPAPIHGIALDLPDTQNLREPDVEKDERVMGVYFEYPSYLDEPSLRTLAEHEQGAAMDHTEAQVKRREVTLRGVRAVRFHTEYRQNGKTLVEDEIVTLRAGIAYHLWLRSTTADYAGDLAQFERLVAGFRFWKIHYCS